MHEILRRLAGAFIVGYIALAPTEIPQHRFDPNGRPVAVMTVGAPLIPIDRRRARTTVPDA